MKYFQTGLSFAAYLLVQSSLILQVGSMAQVDLSLVLKLNGLLIGFKLSVGLF